MKCKYCTGSMVKKGNLDSGNVKYDIFYCKACGHEEHKAVALKSSKALNTSSS